MRKVVFLGATRGMGRALARLLAERGDALCLLGRDEEELKRSVADLSARRPGTASVSWAVCDLEKVDTFGPALDVAQKALGGFDTCVVTAGLFATQEKLETDSAFTERLLQANFTHTVLFCEEVRRRLLKAGGGTLCVFSSVAGERGRKPVILYGASKAGLSAYLEGLDHKFRAQGLKTVCVKPGFVHTDMTEGLKAPPFAGLPEGVAKSVLKALDAGTPVVYVPAIWKWVMAVIRLLPRFVMRKVGF
jgi:short-subunit dehydrogenase